MGRDKFGAMRRFRVLAAAMIVALVGVVMTPTTALAADPVGIVKVNTQKTTGPNLGNVVGTWTAGSRLNLECYERGQRVKGYYSSYFPGGWDDLWYKVRDTGNWVADIDIDTKSNNPVTPQCSGSSSTSAPLGTPVGIDPAASFQLIAKNSGLAVDVEGGTAKNGTLLWQYGVQNPPSNAQKFRFVANGDGTYRIVSALSTPQLELVLDVKDGNKTKETKVQIWKWSNNPQQKWRVTASTASGYVTISPVHAPGQCLDVAQASTTAKARIQIYDCNNTPAQQFKMVNLNPPLGRNGWAYPIRPSSTLSTYTNSDGSPHNGDDFSASPGQAVYSMSGGTVVEAGAITVGSWCPAGVPINGKQNEIVISTSVDGVTYLFRYAHLSEIKVKVGDPIYAGQLIGSAGKTGCARGVHLHVDIRKNNVLNVVYPRKLLGVTSY